MCPLPRLALAPLPVTIRSAARSRQGSSAVCRCSPTERHRALHQRGPYGTGILKRWGASRGAEGLGFTTHFSLNIVDLRWLAAML
jgi:hypothetical protein